MQSLNEADSVILDMVFQHCDVKERKTVWEITHLFLSANEGALFYLWKKGIVKNKRNHCVYTLSKKVKS